MPPNRPVKLVERLDVTILLPPARDQVVESLDPLSLELSSSDALGLLSLQSNGALELSSVLGQELPQVTQEETKLGWKNGVKVGFYEKKVPVKTGKKVQVDAPYRQGGTKLGRYKGALSGLSLSQDAVDFASMGDVAYIAQIRPMGCTWTRNNLSEADELSVTLLADAFGGLDIRLIRAIQVDHWLVPADYPFEQLTRGGPGYFGGVATRITQSRFANELVIECRDYTHLLEAQEMNAAVGSGVDLNQTLTQIVEGLVKLVPGGERWEVKDDSGNMRPEQVALDRLEAQSLNLEAGTSRVNTGPSGIEIVSDTNARGTALDPSLTDSKLAGSLGSLAGPVHSNDQQAQQHQQQLKQHLDAEIYARRKYLQLSQGIGQVVPGRFMTHPQWGFTQGGGRMSVWSAILRLCALVGAVPEFEVSQEGVPTVHLVDAELLQAGKEGLQFRQFVRRDPDGTERFHRRFTVGLDVWGLEEERHLETEKRVDRVDVVSYVPDTGEVIKGSYGTPSRKKAGTETVETITSHGITDVQQLEQIAKVSYQSRVGQEYAVKLTTMQPASTGGLTEDGPPDTPEGSAFEVTQSTPETSYDLLYCAPGAALEIVFPGFESRNMGGTSLVKDAEAELLARLGGKGVPWAAEAARAISEAMERVSLVTIFQLKELRHTWDGEAGQYDAELELQAFLEDVVADSAYDYPRVLRDATGFKLLGDG